MLGTYQTLADLASLWDEATNQQRVWRAPGMEIQETVQFDEPMVWRYQIPAQSNVPMLARCEASTHSKLAILLAIRLCSYYLFPMANHYIRPSN